MAYDGVEAVLNFWFGTPGTEDASYAQRRKLWFGKSPEVDAYIRTVFYPLYTQAALGELEGWRSQPHSILALILLLDQFPRNLFRDVPQAFATDEQALTIAKQAIAQGFDQQLSLLQRLFVYLPLEHSEALEDQHQAVAFIAVLAQEDPDLADPYDYALRHRDVIERFGRFPHRNAVLGRVSTPEEEEFLKQPGSRF